MSKPERSLLVTIPHSGEQIPALTPWLQNLPEEILMCDVDRYVDILYGPALQNLNIPSVLTPWHRYAVDLNRIPEDIDASTVVGAPLKAGTHARGYHWKVTTYNDLLLPEPLSQSLHQNLTELIYQPFHDSIRQEIQKNQPSTARPFFHIDAHSMPSVGTSMHRDPGERRADIVVSDCLGKSCHFRFKDLVIAAYATAGFKVAYNWPYMGGRVTEQYGHPQQNHHAIQVELNRDLYMNEKTKKIKTEHLDVQKKIQQALSYIQGQLQDLNVS